MTRIFHRPAATRRQVLAGIGAGAATLAAPGLLRAQSVPTMTVPNSGGLLEEAYRAAYFNTFEAETGTRILGAPYMEAGRVKAMVEANAVDVDVLNIDFAEAAVLAREGLLEPIDYSIVDKTPLLDWAADEFYIVSDVAATVMGWNTQTFSDETRPKSWAEFFDAAAVPGQRSLWKLAPQTLEVACLAAGIPREELYPLDLDAAFASLDRIKPDLTWWTSGAQSAQLLISNEVDVGTAWNGRLHQPRVDGAPVDFTFDNCIFTCDAFVVPKGARNKELAMRFLATILDAQNQAVFAQHIPYGPTNIQAFDLLSPEVLALLPNSPENGATGALQNVAYWAEHGDAIFRRFNEWVV